MAKRRKRPTRRGPGRPRVTPEEELLDALGAALDAPGPGPLLGNVSLLLSTTYGEDAPPVAELVRSLSDFQQPETAAALLGIATLTGDVELRRRVRREIGAAGQVLPRWLAELDRTEPVGRAVEVSSVYGDIDRLVVGATVPGDHPLTAIVIVDNELGAFAADGFVVEAPVDDVVPVLLEDADPDPRAREIPPAEARARIEDALRELELGPGSGGYDDWTERRPLVEWLVALLPPGGEVPDSDLSDDELDEVAARFLASDVGSSWTSDALRPLVDDVLASASTNGRGDPLIWSPRNVHRLLDPRLWFLDSTTPELDRAPTLVRDLIRYGHAERGLRPSLTEAALAAVDEAEAAFLDAVRRPDGEG